MTHDLSEQVVITGAGLVSGLGLSVEETWQSVRRGQCALRPLSVIESALPPHATGGEAPPLPEDFAPDLPREARYLKWALRESRRSAGLEGSESYPSDRCALVLGTTLHGMRAAGRYLRSGQFETLRAFLAGDILQLAAADLPIANLGASVCSACSSSLVSVSLGVAMLRAGEADVVFAGGYDAIGEYVYGGFNGLRLVADGPVKPFARDRAGMKLAEGYGIVVLERRADAVMRGAKPLAAVLATAESSDAHHLTQPHPQGEGAARAIGDALEQAGLSPADIGLIAAHATGTRDNDAGEYAAFSQVFGDALSNVPAVAFKSHLGHTLGGAGAVELILSAMALRDQVVPACVNVSGDEVEFANLRLATGASRPAAIDATLNTSLGFGGANSCVILGRPGPGSSSRGQARGAAAVGATPRAPARDVYVTGIGVLLPGIIGHEAFLNRLSSEHEPAWLAPAPPIGDEALEGLLSARRVRRMSHYVKLTLAAATLALRDAGVSENGSFAESCAALLGTMHGSSSFCVEYYSRIVKEGLIAANPILFAEGVPNAGAAQLSLMLGIKGPCQSIIGTRTAALDAMALAALRIGGGEWERAIVGGGEEACDLVSEAHRRCGSGGIEGCAPFSGESGFVSGAGAVLFVLESAASMAARGGKARGRIEKTARAFGDRAHAPRSVRQVVAALGETQNVISSACGTWIDRIERTALLQQEPPPRVTSIYGHVPEMFSVAPLAGIAATLLGRKLPLLLGDGTASSNAVRLGPNDSFAALCTDLSGPVSGVRIRLP